MLAEGIHFQNSENARKKSLEIYQPQGYAEFNWSSCKIITKTTQKNKQILQAPCGHPQPLQYILFTF